LKSSADTVELAVHVLQGHGEKRRGEVGQRDEEAGAAELELWKSLITDRDRRIFDTYFAL
jgi:hypothetical protein